MSVNAAVPLNNSFSSDADIKSALHKLRKQLSHEGYRQPAHVFVKISAKKYRHRKKLLHLVMLKKAKDKRYHSKYRQPRPIDDTNGKQYRLYLWRKFASGMTFQVPKTFRRSPWQLKQDIPYQPLPEG